MFQTEFLSLFFIALFSVKINSWILKCWAGNVDRLLDLLNVILQIAECSRLASRDIKLLQALLLGHFEIVESFWVSDFEKFLIYLSIWIVRVFSTFWIISWVWLWLPYQICVNYVSDYFSNLFGVKLISPSVSWVF